MMRYFKIKYESISTCPCQDRDLAGICMYSVCVRVYSFLGVKDAVRFWCSIPDSYGVIKLWICD